MQVLIDFEKSLGLKIEQSENSPIKTVPSGANLQTPRKKETNKEFGQKKISEISRFDIKPLGIPLNQLKNFLDQIYLLLDEAIAKSSNPSAEVFSKTENDYDRHYLAIEYEDEIYGIACLSYD